MAVARFKMHGELPTVRRGQGRPSERIHRHELRHKPRYPMPKPDSVPCRFPAGTLMFRG